MIVLLKLFWLCWQILIRPAQKCRNLLILSHGLSLLRFRRPQPYHHQLLHRMSTYQSMQVNKCFCFYYMCVLFSIVYGCTVVVRHRMFPKQWFNQTFISFLRLLKILEYDVVWLMFHMRCLFCSYSYQKYSVLCVFLRRKVEISVWFEGELSLRPAFVLHQVWLWTRWSSNNLLQRNLVKNFMCIVCRRDHVLVLKTWSRYLFAVLW